MGVRIVKKFSAVSVDGLSCFSLGPWPDMVLGKPGAPQMLVTGMNELIPITE